MKFYFMHILSPGFLNENPKMYSDMQLMLYGQQAANRVTRSGFISVR